MTNKRREAGRAGHLHVGRDLVVGIEDLAEAFADGGRRAQREDALVARLYVAEAEGGNEAVVVERLERLAQREYHSLIRIQHVRVERVQRLAAERALSLLYVAERVVDADHERTNFYASLAHRVCHLLQRAESIEYLAHVLRAIQLEQPVRGLTLASGVAHS